MTSRSLHSPVVVLVEGCGLAVANHAVGSTAEAESALGELVGKLGDAAAIEVAELHAYGRDVNQALQWLDRKFAQRDPR